jgi:hypothetical protein
MMVIRSSERIYLSLLETYQLTFVSRAIKILDCIENDNDDYKQREDLIINYLIHTPSRLFPIGICILPLTTILTQLFRFIYFYQIPQTRSPVVALDLALLDDIL